MAGIIKYGQGAFDPIFLPRWEFREGGAATVGASASTILTAPVTDPPTNILQLAVDGGPVTYALNGAVADNNSGGWIPADGRETIGPLHAFTQCAVFAQADAVVHYQWFREHD